MIGRRLRVLISRGGSAPYGSSRVEPRSYAFDEERPRTASAEGRAHGLSLLAVRRPDRVLRERDIVPCGGGGDRLCFAGLACPFPC
jgi:hypothetical protein